MICFNFLYGLCKRAAMTTINQVLASAPFRETSTPLPSQGESPWIPETPLSSSENSSAIDTYNAAINEIALLTPGVSWDPLLFQLGWTDVSEKTLDVQSIEGFSSYHNFAYETGGVRVWKSHGIGPAGKINSLW